MRRAASRALTGPSPSATSCRSESPIRSFTVASVTTFAVAVAADFHVVLQPFEVRPERPGTPLDQQVERGLRRLELVAWFSMHDHGARIWSIKARSCWTLCLRGQGDDVRAAGQLADQNPPFVADPLRIDVLVAGRGPRHGVHVHAALVGERTLADKRLLVAEVQVGRLVHEARQLGQLFQLPAAQHLVALFLEGQVGR